MCTCEYNDRVDTIEVLASNLDEAYESKNFCAECRTNFQGFQDRFRNMKKVRDLFLYKWLLRNLERKIQSLDE